jgi:hypothetical protein
MRLAASCIALITVTDLAKANETLIQRPLSLVPIRVSVAAHSGARTELYLRVGPG